MSLQLTPLSQNSLGISKMLRQVLLALILSSMTQLSESDEKALSYNGGKIMTEPIKLSLLWFGNKWQSSGQEALRNAILSLTSTTPTSSEVPTLRKWWEIIRQYTDSSGNPATGNVNLGPQCSYTGPTLNVTVKTIMGIGGAVFNKTLIGFNNSDENGELRSRCSGEFEPIETGGGLVKMVWARKPTGPSDQCSWVISGRSEMGPPNGDKGLDDMIGFVLGNIAEQVTNGDDRGWTDGFHGVSSLCASQMETGDVSPAFVDPVSKVRFNMIGTNAYRYMVQEIWDQRIKNCALQISEECSSTVTYAQVKGYISCGITVNHSTGLQPYPPSQKCTWKIHYPSAKFISFTPNYLLIAPEDTLNICKSESNHKSCIYLKSDDMNLQTRNKKIMGSEAYVAFSSGSQVPPQSKGWEIKYSAGLCDGTRDMYQRSGDISYSLPTGFSYTEGLNCKWVLHGKPGTLVSLNFTHINTSKDLDFLLIYNGTGELMNDRLFNFSGIYSDNNLPRVNLTGKVTVIFKTQTEDGNGWSVNYYISSPANQYDSFKLILVFVLVAIFMAFCLVVIIQTLPKWEKLLNKRENEKIESDLPNKLRSVKLEIEREEYYIGSSPSVRVYRAILTDGHVVAVKSLSHTRREVPLEEEILIKSSHPNIVSLIGYSHDKVGRRLLIFEFMTRGSLSSNLKESGGVIGWEKRLTMALQVSSALQHLHMYSKPPICHANLNSKNIFLDDSWNAKLGGFGNAAHCRQDSLGRTNRTEMAKDVCNLGLLLMELLTGKDMDEGYDSLFGLMECISEVNALVKIHKFLDPRLEVPKEESKYMGLVKLGEVAKWCVYNCRGEVIFPNIGDVVLGLNQVKQLFQVSFPH
ncbi:hypothetical protein AMTRI_Chr01g129700 [Amborella trichopoda]